MAWSYGAVLNSVYATDHKCKYTEYHWSTWCAIVSAGIPGFIAITNKRGEVIHIETCALRSRREGVCYFRRLGTTGLSVRDCGDCVRETLPVVPLDPPEALRFDPAVALSSCSCGTPLLFAEARFFSFLPDPTTTGAPGSSTQSGQNHSPSGTESSGGLRHCR